MSTQSESIGVYVPVSELVPWDQNPRLNESAVEEVAKSIKRFGFASPIIARTADNMVIAGHTRLLAAKKIGLKSVPVRFMDLDLNDAQLLALADNKIGEIADWDENKLKDILASLDDQDLSGLGWSDDELDALIDHHEPVELNGDPDHVPEVQELAITSAGDLWLLGDHRLLCGDSTKEEDVGRLMAGEKADVLFTDPPYGINFEPQRGTHKKIMNDNLSDQDFIDFLDKVFSCAFKSIQKNSFAFVWTGWSKLGAFEKILKQYFKIQSLHIWVKNNFGIGYYSRPKHEPFYMCLKGKPDYPEIAPADVWEAKKVYNTVHSCEKPVDLINEILGSYKSFRVLDLFGGSGSTLIACEETNRKCFMMELDPEYCDVIIRRWQDLTGKEAVKENGIKFNDITDIPW